jgi:autotransporter passenger strand-loop-strand repeat protein
MARRWRAGARRTKRRSQDKSLASETGRGCGGVTSLTTVNSGGTLAVLGGGLANLTTVNSGGKEDVVFNGITSVTQVNSGGLAFIQSGGQVLGGLTLAGGTAAISGSMAAGQSVTFIGPGGDLALFNLPDFGAAIGGFGFGDQIDLATIPFGSGSTVSFTAGPNNTSGTLTVTNGAAQAELTLLGSYETSDFTLASDTTGMNGTLVKLAF